MLRIRRATDEEAAEMDRIRGEGWTISPARKRGSTSSQPESTQASETSTNEPSDGSPDESKPGA